MKLLIQHRHLPDEISGVLTYINLLTPGLEQRGVAVTTVSTGETRFWQWLKPIFAADLVHMNSNHLPFLICCKLLRKPIILKYHYLLYQSTHDYYQPLSFKQRLVAELQRTLPKPGAPLKWQLFTVVKWLRLLTRLTVSRLADYRLACSKFLAESCAFPWPVAVGYNPIAVLPQPPKTLADLQQPYTFVFVGRLNRDKGVDILLRAAQILSQRRTKFQITLVGEGQDAQSFQALTQSLNLQDQVQFLGKLPAAEVAETMRTALALVVPSRWQEPAGYVVQEAAAVQTCSIAANLGGLPEMVGPGLLFAPESAESLAEQMLHCLEYPEQAIQLGQKAYRYVSEQFAAATIAQDLIEICQDLAG